MIFKIQEILKFFFLLLLQITTLVTFKFQNQEGHDDLCIEVSFFIVPAES